MPKTLVAFKATKEEREKLNALALGHDVTVSDILRELVRRVPVVQEEKMITITRFASPGEMIELGEL